MPPRWSSTCRDGFEQQVPFDYDLAIDDRAFYCVEMTEKAFRNAGLTLSEPVRWATWRTSTSSRSACWSSLKLTSLKLDQRVFFPGNERHGIWSSPLLVTVYPPTPPAARPSAAEPRPKPSADAAPKPAEKPAAARPKSVAGPRRAGPEELSRTDQMTRR